MKREGLTPQSPLDQFEHALRQHQNQGDINDLFNHKYVTQGPLHAIEFECDDTQRENIY